MVVPLHLLIIEDSEDDALLLLREVARGGYDIACERVDAPEALVSALDRRPWDLIISDFSMPRFSGADALSLVRNRQLETPFIFVSGTLGEETAVAALKNGAQDYLVKGNLQRLLPAIQRELRESTARRERKQLEQQIQQLQKFEAIGRLAGGIAHDFNNVLGAILGWVELACGDSPSPRVYQRLVRIREQTERAAGLTAQLLAYARRQVLQRRRISVNALVEQAADFLRTVIAEHIEVRILPAADLRTTMADPVQIEQVLMNLCLNARDSMPDGGRLTIATQNVELDAAHCGHFPGVQPGSFVQLAVSDTGTGMTAETLEQIFEPFFTTKEVGKGTGLGLATVYGIVQQNGGIIECESKPGEGTMFRVFLPSDDGPAEAQDVEDHTQLRKGTETILLAEDHDGLRDSGQCILEALGYRVLVACDGAEAVDRFRQHANQISVVVLDAVMPKLSGPDAHRKMSAIRPGVRVIYTTGYASDARILAAMRDSGAPLLQKPYTPSALTRAIGKALGP
jgi:signal transduction histidine kinase